MAAVAADQAAPARRHPRARSPRRRDGGAGAVDEHAAGKAAARRVAPRRFPDQGQRALALEVPPGGLLHLRVGGDPPDADRRRRPGRRARSRCTRGSTSGASAAAPPAKLHEELWLPHHAPIVGNVAALVPHKGQRHLIEAAALVVRQVPDARFVIAGEGELRPALERADQGAPAREARLARRLPPGRAVGAQGVRHLRR